MMDVKTIMVMTVFCIIKDLLKRMIWISLLQYIGKNSVIS